MVLVILAFSNCFAIFSFTVLLILAFSYSYSFVNYFNYCIYMYFILAFNYSYTS